MPSSGAGSGFRAALRTHLAPLVLYTCSSSLLLVANGVFVAAFRFAALLLAVQTVASVVAVPLLKLRRVPGALRCARLRANVSRPLLLLFVAVLLSGIMPLRSVPVETVIAVRSLSSLVVAACEQVIARRRFSLAVWACLGIVCAGSLLYGLDNISLRVEGVQWLVGNALVVSLYNLVARRELRARSSDGDARADDPIVRANVAAFANNVVSLPLFIVAAVIEARLASASIGDVRTDIGAFAAFATDGRMLAALVSPASEFFLPLWAMLISCVFGYGVTTAGLELRSAISATAFTVLANVNKVATVAFSRLLAEHAMPLHQIAGVLVCLLGAFLYSLQSSRESRPPATQVAAEPARPNEDAPNATPPRRARAPASPKSARAVSASPSRRSPRRQTRA